MTCEIQELVGSASEASGRCDAIECLAARVLTDTRVRRRPYFFLTPFFLLPLLPQLTLTLGSVSRVAPF